MSDKQNHIYGEAVPTPSGLHPWAAVLYGADGKEISRAVAESRAEAEKLVLYFLQKLATFARKGFEEDDDA